MNTRNFCSRNEVSGLNFQFRCSRKAHPPGNWLWKFGCSPLWSVPFVDAIYDCSSLYQKNYRISGVYKLPPDDFLGSPELEVRSPPPIASILHPQRAGDNRASQSLEKRKLKMDKQTHPITRELPKQSMYKGKNPRHLFVPSNRYQPNSNLLAQVK